MIRTVSDLIKINLIQYGLWQSKNDDFDADFYSYMGLENLVYSSANL